MNQAKSDKIKTAVIMMNMGGPESLDGVEPFLYNLFMDPDIIDIPLGRFFRPLIAGRIARSRSSKVREYYKKIGGKSPLLALTLEQAASLEEALKNHGNFTTYVAMRYARPFTAEALGRAISDGTARIILLPLYPHYSKTTTGSSLNEFQRLLIKSGRKDIELIKIRDWHSHKMYIRVWADKIKEALKGFKNARPVIIFSAHGIPQKYVTQGDPYQVQTEESVRLVLKELNWKGEWRLSYQSRVGPMKWLQPNTIDIIRELGKSGASDVMMVPISFVSDHSETLYEMDIMYKELSADVGIKKFERVSSLNSDPRFINALKHIVLASLRPA